MPEQKRCDDMVTSVTRGTVKLRKNEMDYFCFGSGKTPFVLLPGLSVKPEINSLL